MIRLYERGYEPFIDFLKGYLILCILFTHGCDTWPELRTYSMYYLWGGAPTACFMLICSMHLFRPGGGAFDVWKVVKRVLAPYILLQFFCIGVSVARSGYWNYDEEQLKTLVLIGGHGVGSYFPWVFVQYYLLNMLFLPIMRRIPSDYGKLLFFLLLSMGIEYFCSTFHISEELYRILALRYPFLIFLGYLIVKAGLGLIPGRMIVAAIGAVFIIIFNLTEWDMEPFFYNNSWKSYHWICYPYFAFFLFYMVYQLYKRLNTRRVGSFLKRIGKGSYGIFLVQSIWYLIPIYQVYDYRANVSLVLCYLFLSFIVCVSFGVMLQEIVLNRYFK